ncbi:MAG: hypothetical protein WD431_12650, partial [Cyclobacteriaceae bacterium]
MKIHSYFINYFNENGKLIENSAVLNPLNVVIEEDVWIGNNVIIFPGTTIGKSAIIGNNNTIKNSVKSGKVVFPKFILFNKYLLNLFSVRFIFYFLNHKIKFKNAIGYNDFFNREISFVLSTGRCGSHSISKILNQHPQIISLHEPLYQQLSVISINYLSGLMNRDEVKCELIKLYLNLPYIYKNTLYVESDQKIAPLAEILLEIFPNSKFIWLIRNPKTFLESARVRGWYLNDEPIFSKDSVLIVPKFYSQGCRLSAVNINRMEKSEWSNLSQDDKILWYWNYWNYLIKCFINNINIEKIFFLKLEEISKESKNILHFFKINLNFDLSIEMTNQMQGHHVGLNSEKKF